MKTPRAKTPADTTLNQVPALFRKIDVGNKHVLDYGCGKYSKGRDYLMSMAPKSYQGYDKFHAPMAIHWPIINLALCANVLNVVHSRDDREVIYIDLLGRNIPEVHFSIYEGDKTGVPSSSQNNLKTEVYLSELIRYSTKYNITKKGNIISCYIK